MRALSLLSSPRGVLDVVWNIFQCKAARELRAENKSSYTMLHHIFEQLFSGSTMRGRQLGSNTGRGGLSWGRTGRECTSGIRRAQAGQNRNKTFIFSDNLSWSWYIYSRYTKHARRSNFNFTIDIRDWTLMDSVRINLNYSGSIFVFWWPSLVPWVAPAHWPVSQSAAGQGLSRPRPPETMIEISSMQL